MSMDHLWKDNDGKTDVFRGKLVPLCPPQFLHRLPWKLIKASRMKG
jgi:hypothetical protein